MKQLTEKEAENFLEKEGFALVLRRSASRKEQLESISKKLSFPWVMKASSPKIVHKGKLGGIILNIKSLFEAEEAFDKLAKIDNFEEVIVQETLSGEEAIIGIKKTPEFGQVLMFGKGGVHVEQEKDVSFRVLPVSAAEIKLMIKETRFYKTLEEKNVNLELLKDVLFKISKLAKKHSDISELDINPLFVNSDNAKIADARIVLD